MAIREKDGWVHGGSAQPDPVDVAAKDPEMTHPGLNEDWGHGSMPSAPVVTQSPVTADQVFEKVERLRFQYPGLFARGGGPNEMFLDSIHEGWVQRYVADLHLRGYKSAHASDRLHDGCRSVFVDVFEASRVDLEYEAQKKATLVDDKEIINRIRPH